jgi:hypothetical protein
MNGCVTSAVMPLPRPEAHPDEYPSLVAVCGTLHGLIVFCEALARSVHSAKIGHMAYLSKMMYANLAFEQREGAKALVVCLETQMGIIREAGYVRDNSHPMNILYELAMAQLGRHLWPD